MDDFERFHGAQFRRRFVDLGLVSSRAEMQTLVMDSFGLNLSRQLCEDWLKGPGSVPFVAPSRGCTLLYDRYREKLLRWHFVVQGISSFCFLGTILSFQFCFPHP